MTRAYPAAIRGLRRCTARATQGTRNTAFWASTAIASTDSRRGLRRPHHTPMTIPATVKPSLYWGVPAALKKALYRDMWRDRWRSRRRPAGPRRPAAQCPAPTAARVTTGTTRGTHSSTPEGLTSSRMGKATRSTWAQLGSRAIPALSPRRLGTTRGVRFRCGLIALPFVPPLLAESSGWFPARPALVLPGALSGLLLPGPGRCPRA